MFEGVAQADEDEAVSLLGDAVLFAADDEASRVVGVGFFAWFGRDDRNDVVVEFGIGACGVL